MLNTHSNRAWAEGDSSQSKSHLLSPRHLLGRLLILAGVMALDCVVVAYIPHSVALIGPLAPFGIAAYAVFLGLGYRNFKLDRDELPFGRWTFMAHVACIAAVWYGIFSGHEQAGFIAGYRVLLMLGVALLTLACIPFSKFIATLRVTHPLWLYSLVGGALAWCMRYPFQSFWDSSSSAPGRFLEVLAFHAVRILLQPLLPGVIVDPDTFIIGTPKFAVRIAEACSGLEGLGLVLVFTIVWLWYFRKESRFPQALLLVPCAMICVWLLNILRIAGLILIGNAGSREIAMVGFHSQAGWIGFTAVALGFSMATRKISWVRKDPADGVVAGASPDLMPAARPEADEDAGESPATRAYLVPFLAILAASFLSKAASGYFEWLYPLRFVVAAVALWYFRGELKKLNWRTSWFAPLAGAAVFAIWIAPTFWGGQENSSLLGESLAGLSPGPRYAWIAFRIAAAVITIPIAEELAFRGYLARRIMGRDFTAIPFRALSMVAIGVSSVGFGVMHGREWLVGIVAGLAYAGVLKARGRIGDAVVAHATSNLLLAAWVLVSGNYSLW